MLPEKNLLNNILYRFNERSKELKCIYKIEELLNDFDKPLNQIFKEIFPFIAEAYQYPSICEVSIEVDGNIYTSEDYVNSKWVQQADIIINNICFGQIKVVYTQLIKEINGSQFLPEEQQLLNTLAKRIGYYLFFRKVSKILVLLKNKHINISAKEFKDYINFITFDHNSHWKWRLNMAKLIVSKIPSSLKGIIAIYLIGSTKEATAGAASDIDFLIHFKGDEQDKKNIELWFDGWSHCLEEINLQITGYDAGGKGLIDLHIITDKDIQEQTSFASMLNSINNSAKLLWQKLN